MTHFQKTLIELMDKYGLTEQDLANIIEVKTSQVQTWLCGKNSTKEPNAQSIIKLVNFFKITSDNLIGTQYATNKED